MGRQQGRPREKAVALRYKPNSDDAPVVIASGYGEVAERIVDIAEKRGIPVFRDDSTASLLCMLEVGKSIPPQLYDVVSAVYCEIMRVSKQIQGGELGSVTGRQGSAR